MGKVLVGLLLLLVIPLVGFSLDKEKPIPGDKVRVSTEEMYARWAKYSPEEVIAHGKKATAAIQKDQKAAFAQFNDANNTTWWPERPFFTPIIVMSCEQERDLTHPIPSFRKQLLTSGVLKKFQDARGVHTFFFLCKKLKGKPNGVWVKQYHYWPGTKEPVWMAVMGMPIEDTDYVLQLFYITKNPDLKALNSLLK